MGLEVRRVKKRSSAIISLLMFLVTVVAQAVFLTSFGPAGEVVGYLETAIVQLYGSGR